MRSSANASKMIEVARGAPAKREFPFAEKH
jgi:hypothetical protein